MHLNGYTDKFDSLTQDCINSSVLAMELLQSCSKPSISSSNTTDFFLKMDQIVLYMEIFTHIIKWSTDVS